MDNHVYKTIELTGSSDQSMEDAIHTAVAKANETIRNMRWFNVIETRGMIEEGQIGYWQVTLKIGFTLEAA